MKAVELGMKSELILQNSFGFYERLFRTHRPLTEMHNHELFQQIISQLESSGVIMTDLEELEGLEPKPFGLRNYEAAREANTEYPFVGRTDPGRHIVVHEPGDYWKAPDAERHYNGALHLVETLCAIDSEIASWKVSCPTRL